MEAHLERPLADPSRARVGVALSGRDSIPSPAALLLEWIMQRIGLGASGVDAPRPANEADGGAKVLKAQKGRRVSLTEAPRRCRSRR